MIMAMMIMMSVMIMKMARKRMEIYVVSCDSGQHLFRSLVVASSSPGREMQLDIALLLSPVLKYADQRYAKW